MANIDGGSLSFKSELDNEQLNAAIDETLRRIKGLSDGTVAAGDNVDRTFAGMSADIRQTLAQIGDACAMHEAELAKLEAKYDELGKASTEALVQGRDDVRDKIEEERYAIEGEIRTRRMLLKELQNNSDELEKAASRMEGGTNAANKFGDASTSIRTKMRLMREELIAMEMAGKRNTDEYRALREELGQLTDAYGDATAQANIMAHDQRGMQGIISGLTGISGAISAATGGMSLFADENENLQKVMTKVQSVMAITIGLQQVQQTFDKDSAFRLVTLGGLKEWWASVVAKSGVALGAETAAIAGNTATTAANATATTAAATATTGFAGAIRLVGTAIKSIPAVGWILTAISAFIAGILAITKESRQAKKAARELTEATIDGCYKAIGSVSQLAVEWNKLGDDFKAKEQFIESNRKKFDELGVSIAGVTDAENLLVSNKNAFIDSEIAKAKAIATRAMAQEKVKELLKKQAEYNAMPDTVLTFSGGTSSSGAAMGTWVDVANTDKAKAKDAIAEMNADITRMFTDAANYEQEGWDVLKNAGIKGANEFASGSVGAIEQAISAKQAALRNATSASEYKAIESDIEKLQNQLSGITGEKKGDKKDDPFLKMLDERKSEYTRFLKWMNSGDEILVKSANKEFAGLLAEGANYMEYLQRQRAQIMSVDESERTAEQVANLAKINNAIAEETRKTVIGSFNKQLNEQLSNANSTLEMLTIIADKRKELAGDNTDLEIAKSESLDAAEERVEAEIKKEREEKAKELARKKEENAKLYSDMLVTYASFEEKRAAINKEYDDKIALATEKGNTELIERLNDAREKAMSSAAIEAMQESPDWEAMFGDLDDLTTAQLQKILSQITGVTGYMGIEFDPKDLEAIKDRIEAIKNEVEKRNPFKALVNAVKDYSKASDDATKKSTSSDMMSALSGSLSLIGESFDKVIGSLSKLGVEMDEQDAQLMDSISGAVSGAANLAMGIATGNPLSIIQGSIDLIVNGIDLFDTKTRESERRINAYKKEVVVLSDAYNDLQSAIEDALGGDIYELQKKSIANLERQLYLTQQLAQEEKGQKNSDEDAVDEYKRQGEEIKKQINDIYDDIAEDLLQTSALSFADNLSSALVDAFRSGEDAAKSFESTVNDILRNIIINQLKKGFLEKQLQGALDSLQNDMGYWDGDKFVFDGLTPDEIGAFKSRVKDATSNFTAAYEMYSDMFGDIFGADTDVASLTGAVKGVSEETAGILSGQANAIRINQIDGNEIMRNQLNQLTQIAFNTAYLSRIYALFQTMQSAYNNDLRSQGLAT